MGGVADSSGTNKRKRADPKLSEDDRKVYDHITSTESIGIPKWRLKSNLKLADPVLNKSIKSLKDKGLIKEVVNALNKKEKHFMGIDFKPTDDLTGGFWYNKEGELDLGFIEASKKLCLQFISRSKVATVGGITEYMNNLPRVFDGEVKFSGHQVEQVLQFLILDKKIVETESNGKGDFAKIPLGEQCYQCSSKSKLPKTGAFGSIPCGVCPRLKECTPDGIISPSTCVYFTKWLDF